MNGALHVCGIYIFFMHALPWNYFITDQIDLNSRSVTISLFYAWTVVFLSGQNIFNLYMIHMSNYDEHLMEWFRGQKIKTSELYGSLTSKNLLRRESTPTPVYRVHTRSLVHATRSPDLVSHARSSMSMLPASARKLISASRLTTGLALNMKMFLCMILWWFNDVFTKSECFAAYVTTIDLSHWKKNVHKKLILSKESKNFSKTEWLSLNNLATW